jgi:hypothetical protein
MRRPLLFRTSAVVGGRFDLDALQGDTIRVGRAIEISQFGRRAARKRWSSTEIMRPCECERPTRVGRLAMLASVGATLLLELDPRELVAMYFVRAVGKSQKPCCGIGGRKSEIIAGSSAANLAKADIPSRVRDRLHDPHAILGGLPHAAVTLKAASRRTGHNSNSWPSVGRSTPPPLSFPTKTFQLMKIVSLSPLQSRVD